MNLTEIFCPNLECPARGHRDAGNISVRCYDFSWEGLENNKSPQQ